MRTTILYNNVMCNEIIVVSRQREARDSVVRWGLCYKQEGLGIESRWSVIFNLLNPSSSTMALGSTQPITEMSTKKIPLGVKGGRRVGLATLPPSVSRLSRKCGNLNISKHYEPPWTVTCVKKTPELVMKFPISAEVKDEWSNIYNPILYSLLDDYVRTLPFCYVLTTSRPTLMTEKWNISETLIFKSALIWLLTRKVFSVFIYVKIFLKYKVVRWDFGYCGHYWPIVPAPDDRWWWLCRNWKNEDWQGKPLLDRNFCLHDWESL
jgi:hypothetical protein